MLNKYSPSLNTFYLAHFFERYEAVGSMPDDAFDVSEEIFALYTGDPPEGMTRIVGADNLPCWTEIPGESNDYTEN